MAWGVMVRMPGTNFAGSPVVMTADEVALRDELRRDVAELAGRIGERNLVRFDALEAAAVYVEAQFGSAGYSVERNEFPVDTPQGMRSVRNVIAEVKGSSRAEEIVIIGAHYDSREGTPGADDNASGTAVVLALARRFAKQHPARTVRFVLFPNEEYFRQDSMGSVVYARLCRSRQENVVAMVSVETIGYYSDVVGSQQYPFPINLLYPDRGGFIGFVGSIASRALVRDAIGAFRAGAGIASEGVAAPESVEGVDWSDHWAFWQEGYPGIMVTDTAPFRNPNYHRATDVPDTLDYNRMARVVSGLVRVVRALGSPGGRY